LSTLRESLQDLRRSLGETPDELMLEVGAGGEMLLARLRLLIALLMIAMPAINYWGNRDAYESLAGLSGVGLVLLLSQAWLLLARQHRRHRWLPFVSSAFDVTLVTLVLWLLALRSPAAGMNSVVVWCFYLMSIFATALRNDPRVTVFAGAMAIVQFVALALFFHATSHGPMVSADYGTVQLSNQIQRVIVLLAATLLTAILVLRMHKLVQLSGTDGLTGLPNRTYLNHRVPQILADARSEGHTLCLVLIDMDNFRHINEDHGHQAGDRALRHAVKAMRLELGRDEPLMRVGGEEFVLILRMPLGAAWERMETLRRQLAAKPFDPGDGAEPRVMTFSAGIATSPQDASQVSGLMRIADLRLNGAKQAGRNRVMARDTH
jgi:two-component system, cell cycle response regulator